MIKLTGPEEITGGERDILAIREMWMKYASPLYMDLLDTEYVSPEDGPPAPFADLDTVRVKPRKIEDPKKRLREVLGD